MADDVWTTGRVLSWIEGYLGEHGDGTPRVSAQWLVSEALGVSRMQLYLDLDRPLTADERAVLRDWTRRRAAGEPLQYITGEAGFRHITLRVAPGVLIPRPETEVLVSEALALLPAAAKPQDAYEQALLQYLEERGSDVADDADGGASAEAATSATSVEAAESVVADEESLLLVADICTGSGCIACSIAAEHPGTRVVATDIAPAAVELARRNAQELGLAELITVLECDLGEDVPDELMGAFDLVVSNPPYIPTAELAQLEQQVAEFEPQLALDGGVDGLVVFRRLLDWSKQALAPGGACVFELHETCLDDAAAEADYAGFTDVRIVQDLAGKPRILTARKR